MRSNSLRFGVYNHLPRCQAQIDRTFDAYALNYAHSGRIRWAMNGDRLRTLQAPVAWWTVPGVRYVYGNLAGESWDHYYVMLSGAGATSLMRGGLLPVAPDACHFRVISQPEIFRGAVESLFSHLPRASFGEIPQARAVHSLEELLLQIGETHAAQAASSPLENAIRAQMEQIRRAPQEAWDIELQARQLAVSIVHLRRVWKRLAGLAPNQFVVKTRLDAAAHLLRTTSLPIKIIAAQCGVGDVYYFSRVFKKQHGASPAAYRREAQLL